MPVLNLFDETLSADRSLIRSPSGQGISAVQVDLYHRHDSINTNLIQMPDTNSVGPKSTKPTYAGIDVATYRRKRGGSRLPSTRCYFCFRLRLGL